MGGRRWGGGRGLCIGVLAAFSLVRLKPDTTFALPLLAGVVVFAWLGAAEWRRWSRAAVAARLESAAGKLDNLVVTAVQIAERPGKVLPFIRTEVAAQADARLSSLDLSGSLPATRAIRSSPRP